MTGSTTPIDEELLAAALAEAHAGFAEGGVPIGAALAIDGDLMATGRNRRIQSGSVIHHAEMDCLENAGRLTTADYARATLYTTGFPCHMCAGAILHYGIPRVVVGTADEFEPTKALLHEQGVTVLLLDRPDSSELVRRFSEASPTAWLEDIGTAAAWTDEGSPRHA